MEYKVSFSGKDGGAEHILIMSRTNDIIKISIDGEESEKSIEISEMRLLLNDHNNIVKHNKGKKLRDVVLANSYPSIIVNLFRSFAICGVSLQYAFDVSSQPDAFVNFITDEFNQNCFGTTRIEDSGSFGKIPVMYFLPNDFDINDDKIKKLYDMGMLHKIEIDIKGENELVVLSNYYVPFEIPKYTNFQMFPVVSVWNGIVRGMEQELISKYGRR